MVALALGILVPAGAWFLQEDPAHSLAAPGDARVDETAATMLRVSWIPVARTDYYEVALIPADKKGPRKTVRSSTPEAQVPSLKAGVDYTVRVRAVVGASKPRDVTPYSRPITARTEDQTRSALLVPRAFTVSAPKPGTVDARWEKIESATGYELQYSTRKDFRGAKAVTSAKPSASINKLDGGVHLYTRVRSNGADGARSAWTAVVEVTSVVPDTPPPVRVASFNVRCHSCGGPSWGARRGPVAALIDAQSPDVVGLQEAQQSRPRGLGTSQFADIANSVSALGADYRVTDPAIGASKGTKIIYKPSTLVLLNKGAIRYSSQRGGATSRYAAWATFRQRSTGKEFVFFSTHLEPKSYGVRLAQARQLAGSLKGIAGNRPVVAVGDFNASQYHYYPVHRAMTGAGLVDVIGVQPSSRQPAANAPAEKRINANFDSFQDMRRIPKRSASPKLNGVYLDYIFTSPMRVLEFENVMRRDSAGRIIGTIPSDHNMLRADLVLP